MITAFGTGPEADEAKAIVLTWFTEERSGLDVLTQLPEVTRILVAHGIPKGEAKKGFYRDLLFHGVTVSANGKTLDLGIGGWTNTAVKSDDGLEHEHQMIDVVTVDEQGRPVPGRRVRVLTERIAQRPKLPWT